MTDSTSLEPMTPRWMGMMALTFLVMYYNKYLTRMVQLPATAAIEYVAACWVSGARGIFVRGAYARSPQVQCVYEPSRLSVPSNVA